MTVLAFFGCALTAYSPALALFMVTIARDPVRIIVLIFRWVICTSTPTTTNDDFNFSAFFWLLSLLFSSVVWVAVYPLKETLAFGLVFSIIFQELFRLALFALFYKADAVLKKLTENEETRIFANRHILAYGKTSSRKTNLKYLFNNCIFYLVVGLGFGMMSGAFSLINVLADSAGPGTVGMRGEHQDFFMVSAVMCLGTILLHTFWGVITFDALNRRKWLNLAFVWASHFTVSCLVRNLIHLLWFRVFYTYLLYFRPYWTSRNNTGRPQYRCTSYYSCQHS